MAVTLRDRAAVLRAIESWPVEDQVNLARTILERVSVSQSQHPKDTSAISTWDALHGIASNGLEPPTDEQVAQWLDERKMKKVKFGR